MQTHDVRQEFQGKVTLRRSNTRYIVVHHAAALYRQNTGIEDVRAVHRYHAQKWPDFGAIGYHVALAEETNGGPVQELLLSDPDLQRAHIWGRNHEAVGVSCLTNFVGTPEPKWIEALAQSVAALKRRYPAAQIVGHGEIALPGHGTACPGPAWPLWRPQLIDRVSALLRPATGVTSPLTTPQGTLAIDEHLPIMGPALVTEAQALAYLTQRPPGHYTVADLRDVILPLYASVCAATGVSFGVAVAQMAHETGRLTSFWSQRPQRNPAGIGVTGRWQAGTPDVSPRDPHDGTVWCWNTQRNRWETGLVFDAWDQAIWAQVARLMGYALADSELTSDQRTALDTHTARRPLPAAARASAVTLRELGAQYNQANVGLAREKWRAGWAWPGATYGVMLASTIRAMRGEAN